MRCDSAGGGLCPSARGNCHVPMRILHNGKAHGYDVLFGVQYMEPGVKPLPDPLRYFRIPVCAPPRGQS